MTTSYRRAGLATALIVLIAVGISTPAWAGAKGRVASGSQTVTSGSWGAVGTTSGGTPATGSPYTLTWTGLGATTQYFGVANTGTFNLSAETYTATNSPLQTTGGVAPTVTLRGCVGANWNTTAGTCSGTQVTLDTTASGATTATAAIAQGSSLSVKATTSLSAFGYTTSVSVSTIRSQVRTATTTNS